MVVYFFNASFNQSSSYKTLFGNKSPTKELWGGDLFDNFLLLRHFCLQIDYTQMIE